MIKNKLIGLDDLSVREAHGLSRAQNEVIDQWMPADQRFSEKALT